MCIRDSTTGACNSLLGKQAGDNITTGSRNIAIGLGVDVPSATANDQFIIGCYGSWWIKGDSSFNLYDKDGKSLGFKPDACGNLFAGDNAGAAVDSDTCLNIFIGCSSGAAVNEGDRNVFVGNYTGCSMTSGGCNVAIGDCSLSCSVTGTNNIALGVMAGKLYEGANGCNIYIGTRAGCGGSGTVDGVNNLSLIHI